MTYGTLRCTRCGKLGHVAASCKQRIVGRRGVAVVQDLKDRSVLDPLTHCWLWQGAHCEGAPRIHVLDYRDCDKRVLSGPLAVWMLAHEKAPRPGWRIIRTCGTVSCVNPKHHEEVNGHAGVGAFLAMSDRLKGTAVEARSANAAKGRAAAGVVDTKDEIIVAVAKRIMQRYRKGDGLALAKEFGLSKGLVSNIATGKRIVPGIGRLQLPQYSHRRPPPASSVGQP